MQTNFQFRKLHGWAGLLLVILTIVFAYASKAGWLDDASQAAQTTQPGLYTVSRFVDGDTIAVNMNGKTEKIRFVGVDTPETHKPNTPVQCYGPAAAAYTKNIIGTKQLRLVSDSKSTDRDRYDRLLRYVYIAGDDVSVNEKLIQNGYGFYYPYFPFTKSDQFAQDQAAAQTAHKGLWGNCSTTKTDKGGYISNNQT